MGKVGSTFVISETVDIELWCISCKLRSILNIPSMWQGTSSICHFKLAKGGTQETFDSILVDLSV